MSEAPVQMELDPERLWTIDEAAYYLKLSRSAVEIKVQTRKIPFMRLSRKCVRFRKEDLDAWLEGRACNPSSRPLALAMREGKGGTQG